MHIHPIREEPIYFSHVLQLQYAGLHVKLGSLPQFELYIVAPNFFEPKIILGLQDYH